MEKEDIQFVRQYVLSRYARNFPKSTIEDFIQEGSIALWKAELSFKPEKGIPLYGYASVLIDRSIQKFIRDKLTIIRTPRSAEHGRYTFQNETSAYTDDDKEFIHPALIFEDDLTKAGVYLDAYFSVMSDQDKKIVSLLYEGMSQREIGEVIGTSQMSVSRYIKRLQEKIRGVMRDEFSYSH